MTDSRDVTPARLRDEAEVADECRDVTPARLREEAEVADECRDVTSARLQPSSDPYISPTGWSLWLHPRRYAALWREREEEFALLRDLLARSEKERERLLSAAIDTERMAREHEEVRRGYEKEITGLREEIKGLEEQLREWEKSQEDLMKLEEVVERFNEQKERYESQIEGLQKELRTQALQLRDLRRRKETSAPEHPRPKINMEEAPAPPQQPPGDDSDWFDPLPDF